MRPLKKLCIMIMNKDLRLPSILILLVPIFMSFLWTYRQKCAHSIFRYLVSNMSQQTTTTNIHSSARKSPYSGTSDVYRALVSDDKVPWNVHWSDYKPTEYTAQKVLNNPPWADDPDANKIKHFNDLDGKLDRRSFTGKYEIDKQTNRPINPLGRTGLSGRGLLGRWGPNHAGDPVVTRWSKDHDDKKRKILEIVLINRRDTGALALPGGMLDPGEHILETVKREFIEEAVNSCPDASKKLEELFKNTISIYKGYVDDPRNTDNSWTESEAINVHDETGELTQDLKLEAGDDATKVKWYRLDRDYKLYGSHEFMIRMVVKHHGAYEYWSDT